MFLRILFQDLKELLERRREYIGRSKGSAWGEVTGAISLVVTICTVDINLYWRVAMLIIALWLGYTALKSLYFCFSDEYNHIILRNEIMDLSRHCFSLAIIKEEKSNRFLLRYVPSWHCKLFFSYPTVENDEEHVKQMLASDLHVPEENIILTYKFHRLHSKFSVKDNVEKNYDHKIYSVQITNLPTNMKNSAFDIDGTQYYWFTFDDMEKDETIMKYNSDVVGFVKEIVF